MPPLGFASDVSLGQLAREALQDARADVFWTDRSDAPTADEALHTDERTGLAIIGGGLTGLWTALLATERDPGRPVTILEAGRIATGASGRNGGFMAASLTHGVPHGAATWPDEMPQLQRLGHENFDAIDAFLTKTGIHADLRRCGKTSLATEPYQVTELAAAAAIFTKYGEEVELLDTDAVRSDVVSPTYQAGLRIRSGFGLVDPARLTWGLAAVARERGVRIFENTPVRDIRASDHVVNVSSDAGSLWADQVVVATSAFPSPLKRLRHFVVPFYDYVLMTEPLTEAQWRSLGWSERQGLTDSANFFHYYRPTEDGRILFGGYDAVYHFGSRVSPAFDQDQASHRTLARHFFQTFPQLEGLRFSHRWGGAIDSTSRFTPVFGTAFDRRVAFAVGYTGLGVAATRFGAAVALDLLDGRSTERTRLRMVRHKPLPFPPEPLRWLAVRVTQAELARQDRRSGRTTLWLRLLDRMGIGFTS